MSGSRKNLALIRCMRFEVKKMEQRLIDGNALLEEINAQRMASMGSFPRRYYVVGDALNSIRNAPTVDAVEVVRCKDCIHWHEPEGVCLKIYSDGNVSPYAWQDRKPDDFCSYGKKII